MYCQVEVYAAGATFSLHMHPPLSSLAINKVGLQLQKSLPSGYLSLWLFFFLLQLSLDRGPQLDMEMTVSLHLMHKVLSFS